MTLAFHVRWNIAVISRRQRWLLSVWLFTLVLDLVLKEAAGERRKYCSNVLKQGGRYWLEYLKSRTTSEWVENKNHDSKFCGRRSCIWTGGCYWGMDQMTMWTTGLEKWRSLHSSGMAIHRASDIKPNIDLIQTLCLCF